MHGKAVFTFLFALLLISLTIITGCGDSGTSPSRSGFYFKLTVVDQGGEPLPDLNISRRCRIEYDDPAIGRDRAALPAVAEAQTRPVTLIRQAVEKEYNAGRETGAEPLYEFSLNPGRPNPGTSSIYLAMDTDITGTCELGISLINWEDEEVYGHNMSLFVGISGVTLIYGFNAAGGGYLPNGIFRSVFTVTETATSSVLFADSVYFCGYTDNDPYRQSIGHTNDNGWFSSRDKGIFPSLQGQQPQMGRDQYGAETGLFSFSSTVDVTVTTELPPMTSGYIYWMTRELVVTGGKNEFDWVFVPDDSVYVE
jgi:hypothetical protein